MFVCVCVHRGKGGGGTHSQHHWIPRRWSLADSHSPNASWQPLGQAHSLRAHTNTLGGDWLTTPTPLRSSLLLLENGHNGCGRVLASDEAQIEVLTSARRIDITTGGTRRRRIYRVNSLDQGNLRLLELI